MTDHYELVADGEAAEWDGEEEVTDIDMRELVRAVEESRTSCDNLGSAAMRLKGQVRRHRSSRPRAQSERELQAALNLDVK